MSKEILFSVTMKDCDMQSFSVGGAGGQRRDHTNTGVRIVHRASGAVGEGRDSRSQHQNKRAAFKKMVAHPKFQFWLLQEKRRLEGQESIEEQVDKSLAPEYLKVEVREDGLWTELKE